MKITPYDFKQVFEAAFIVNRKYLKWDTSPRATANMIAYIYRTIANSFPGLVIEYEYNNIDVVLYRGNLDNIKVAIEHENNVKSVATELENFRNLNIPLNVLITYTGNRDKYLVTRQKDKMNKIEKQLMLILNPEKGDQIDPNQYGLVCWEYYIWEGGKLESVPPNQN